MKQFTNKYYVSPELVCKEQKKIMDFWKKKTASSIYDSTHAWRDNVF
jgi:hypothetical protein